MGTILIIGSGRDVYREYVLRSVAQRHRIVLLENKPATWQTRYVAEYHQIDLGDPDALVRTAQELHRRAPLSGVMAYDELYVEPASQLALLLGLPANPPGVARNCRDKATMRQRFAAAGVPSAASHLVGSLDQARASADAIGYPVVLKPRALGGSIGVTKVAGPAELEAAYRVATEATCPGFAPGQGILVEEYLDGPEVSIESVVFDGQVSVVAITRKQVGFAPFFEEIGHVVSCADPSPDDQAIRQVTLQAHRALGVTQGITHTELRVTSRGPRMLEIGLRLGGDLIPYLAYLATGVDMAAAAAAVACGQAPLLQPTRQRAAAVRFLYPAHDGLVRRLELAQADDPPPWLDQCAWVARAGDTVRLPPRGFLARLALLVVTGDSAAQCAERLGLAERRLLIDLEPLA